jgi:uroporphyrinogen decarboxylase
MTSRERIRCVLEGRRPDRPAASFWRHHPRHEITAAGLVEATRAFQRRYDWDLVKINPRAEYHTEAWGNRYAFYEDEHRRPSLIRPRVQSARDWRELAVIDPTDGVLGVHLEAVRRIRQELGPDVPMVMTVFTPLSVAAELAGVRETRPAEILAHADELHRGFRTITDTFRQFVRELVAAGCDGIFLATTRVGTRASLSDEEFRRFSRPYDLELLAAAEGSWLNVLHVCGAQAMLDLVLDYPAQVLSWDMREPSNPGPDGMIARSQRAAIGGIAQQLTADPGRRHEVLAQARDAIERAGSHRLILGAGCVVPTDVCPAALDDVRRLVEQCC